MAPKWPEQPNEEKSLHPRTCDLSHRARSQKTRKCSSIHVYWESTGYTILPHLLLATICDRLLRAYVYMAEQAVLRDGPIS